MPDAQEETLTVPQAEKPIRRLPSAVSYSKLTTYDRCTELYKLKYVLGVPESKEDTLATRLGSICHASLEAYYLDGGQTITSPYDALTRDGGIWEEELAKVGLNLPGLRRDLQNYAHHMTKLYYRASAQYAGADKIRKADGTVSVAPQMTTAWKQYVKAHALDALALYIDTFESVTIFFWKCFFVCVV